MKYLLFLAVTLSYFQLMAQQTSTFYTYNWKKCSAAEARFFSTLEKTDSGWLRYDYFVSGPKLQMKALFEDSACTIYNGTAIFFHANGNVASVGREVHNKNEGVCINYHYNGMMADSATYHNGKPVGARLQWYPNGSMEDSINHINDSMDVELGWHDNGAVSEAGIFLKDKMYGKWQFFHSNGQLAGIEKYDNGKLLAVQYFNADGTPQTDTAKAHSDASFKDGQSGWQSYLSKHLFWPSNYEITNSDKAVVVVQMTINEDGKPENVEVVTPFFPAFDKIAVDVIKKCPNWKPRISHNRKQTASFRQPVTFRQQDE